MDRLFLLFIFVADTTDSMNKLLKLGLHSSLMTLRFEDSCDSICEDLPKDDNQPVCMMFSRYKKYYQFFINECHARRAICKGNLLLHLVHQSRCLNSNQYFMPVN